MPTHIATSLVRIYNKQARIGVIGLGYVGLPLAVEFARAGFDVTGFDVDATKVDAINAGRSYIPDVTQQDLADVVALPMLEARGLVADRDFFLAFSPERVDPGNQQYTTRNIPKIVGGYGPSSAEAATALYAQVVSTVIPVSSTRVAEMVKLLEN